MNPTKKLNDKQAEAAHHPGGPLLIAAGAGSGKTHTLVSRMKFLMDELHVPPERILAITFTNKAAEEMKKRTGATTGTFVGTFHSWGARLLRLEARQLGRTPSFTIFDEDDAGTLIKHIAKNRNLSKETCGVPIIARLLGTIKSELLSPEEAAKNAPKGMEPETAAAIWEDYERALKENNAFDFDDLIQKPVELFEKHPETLAKWQAKYDHVLIDEYQDINAAQYQLVKLLAGKHRNLSVVGDDAQSIYAFRGADFRNFLNFERDWVGAKVVVLEENYRSTPVILEAANCVIKNNAVQKQKNLWTKNTGTDKIRVYAAENEEHEAEWIVKSIVEEMRRGTPLEGIAILYRTNAQSRALEQTLIAAGLPYRIFGGIRFYERKEIKDIVAGLRVAMNPSDAVAAERLTKNFSKGKATGLIESLPRMGGSATPEAIIGHFLQSTNYIEYLKNNYKNSRERIENVQGLLNFARTFSGEGGLTAFLESATLVQQTDNPKGRNGVNLMSIHMSKGLEFDVVFVAGASEGILPHHRSYSSADGMEEERRLMYVATTRAGKRLSFSFTNIPSRFLYEIAGDLVEFVNSSERGGKPKPMPSEEDLWLDYD